MPLLNKTGELVENDWVEISQDDRLPTDRNVLVPPARFHAARNALAETNVSVGLTLAPEDDVNELTDLLENAPVVAISFPAFKDGRGFSQARLLRQNLGYQGEIRAMGDLIMDQYAFLLRCGVDSVDIARGQSAEAWRKAAEIVSVTYQPAVDTNQSAFTRRHRATN